MRKILILWAVFLSAMVYLLFWNSKAAESLNVPVDYCLAKFVKKQSGSKPGMVNYTNFSTIIVK